MSQEISYRYADAATVEWAAREWSTVVSKHMCIDNGFTIVVCVKSTPIGVIAIKWCELPAPLSGTRDAYIDIIEVRPQYRRLGIARELIMRAAERAVSEGAYQLRGWSSEDKKEAIPMWKALGFALCPTTIYPRGQDVKGYYFARVLGESVRGITVHD